MGGPDIIIHGADTYLLHFALEQPAAAVVYNATVDVVESNFVLPSGLPATREQIMQVLERLQGIHVRATYWDDSVTTRSVISYSNGLKKFMFKLLCLTVKTG